MLTDLRAFFDRANLVAGVDSVSIRCFRHGRQSTRRRSAERCSRVAITGSTSTAHSTVPPAGDCIACCQPVRSVWNTSPTPFPRSSSSDIRSSACIALLDPKRANNISIILSRLKMPFEEMSRAIIEVDMEALLLMDEADIADLGLAKGARVKLRSYLRKNFSDYEG